MQFLVGDIPRFAFGFANPNHAAAAVCALAPFLWGWRRFAWVGWIASAALVVMLAMTFSRTGLAVLVAEMVTWAVVGEAESLPLLNKVVENSSDSGGRDSSAPTPVVKDGFVRWGEGPVVYHDGEWSLKAVKGYFPDGYDAKRKTSYPVLVYFGGEPVRGVASFALPRLGEPCLRRG